MSHHWYLYQDNEQKGPFTWEELCARARMQAIKGDDLVWHESISGWARVEAVPGLLTAPAAPTQDPPPPPPFPGWNNGKEERPQQRGSISPQRDQAPLLPPRGKYAKAVRRSYLYEPAEAEAEANKAGSGSGARGLKFRLTPVIRINWVALLLLGIILAAILISRILGL